MDEQELRNHLAATDKLLKAVTSLLVVEHPERLAQLHSIFAIAAKLHSPIAEMPDGAWKEISEELDIIGATFGPDLH